MQRSYLVKSPVHFADFGFFVKVGDILVHDVSNANKLTIYRNGEIVKAVKQTPLGIAAMVKNQFIEEVKAAAKAPAKPVPVPPKPAVAPKKAEPKPEPPKAVESKPEPKKSGMTAEEFTPAVKRGKAVPVEVPADQMPERLKKALEIEDEK